MVVVVEDVNLIALLSDYQLAVIKIQKLVKTLNLISLGFEFGKSLFDWKKMRRFFSYF